MIFLNSVTKGLIKRISLELMRSAYVFTNTKRHTKSHYAPPVFLKINIGEKIFHKHPQRDYTM